MKTLFIILTLTLANFLTGCSKPIPEVEVDKYGVTKEVEVNNFEDREAAAEAVKRDLKVLCLRNGYEGVKILKMVSSKYTDGSFGARGVGSCTKHEGF